MYLVNNIKLKPLYNKEELFFAAAKSLFTTVDNIQDIIILKKSIDARKRADIKFILTLAVNVKNNNGIKGERYKQVEPFKIPKIKNTDRPLIVGFGPAGMFAALILARAGAMPIILERGKEVDERQKDIKRFYDGGKLNVNSNIQFGEGGAGTFSDGKLGSGIKSPYIDFVYNTFVKKGAPEEILYLSKPHVGSDKLSGVVKEIRKEIIALGGEIRFETTFTGIVSKNNQITTAITDKGEIETNKLILAIGHSARDTFEMLYKSGIEMVSKPFSVGARIEHLQEQINISQYGDNKKGLSPADYKLSCHLKNGLSVYTFCMCPGGFVSGAASEENSIVTNGYSKYKRDGINANSAVLVGISSSVFGSNPMAGIKFVRSIEKSAFNITGTYKAPCQTVGDFLNGVPTREFGDVLPTYMPGVVKTDISACLPQFVVEAMKEGLQCFDNKIKGFANPNAILTAPETRSSSPLRIVRNENTQSNIKGIYAVGEGSGYAGGITSSAVDGIKAALAILNE